MDSFHDDNIIFTYFEKVPMIFPHSGLEVENRKLYLFTVQQPCHIPIKCFKIHGLQALEIIVAILILRIVFTVHKIVIRSYRMWSESHGTKLDTESVGKCCLARRARPGYQYYPTLLFGNFSGYLIHAVTLHSLAYQYELQSLS